MAKKGSSWWYRHIGIKVGALRRVFRKGSTLFLRAIRWLFSPNSTSVKSHSKKSQQKKNTQIVSKESSIHYGETGISKTPNIECGLLDKEEKTGAPSFSNKNGVVLLEEEKRVSQNNQSIASLTEYKEKEDIVDHTPQTIERKDTYKLSIVKEGESDKKPIIDENKTIGTLWKENIDRFFLENMVELQEKKMQADTVKNLEISKGRITAKVTGENKVDYKIIITIEPLTEIQIESFYNDGKKQKDLFPTKKDFWLFCNCDIHKKICEHMLVTLYAVGDLMDKDNTAIYRLRGL